MSAVQREEVRRRVQTALSELGSFDNFHGISTSNLPAQLVEPYEILVDPDDGDPASPAKTMWVVLEELPGVMRGYCIVLDLDEQTWGVAEPLVGGAWILTVAADSLEDALTSM